MHVINLLAELDKVEGDDEGYDRTEFDSFFAFVRATALDRTGRAVEAWKDLVPANRAIFASIRAKWSWW